MRYKTITISKSKTIGMITPDGRTRYSKIQLSVAADLDDKDNPSESYKELTNFIEEQFEYEKTIK